MKQMKQQALIINTPARYNSDKSLRNTETTTHNLTRFKKDLNLTLSYHLGKNLFMDIKSGLFATPSQNFLAKNEKLSQDELSCPSTQGSEDLAFTSTVTTETHYLLASRATTSGKGQNSNRSFFQCTSAQTSKITTTTCTCTGVSTTCGVGTIIRTGEDVTFGVEEPVREKEVGLEVVERVKQTCEGDKKLKSVLKIFEKFEDLCIENRLVNQQTAAQLRNATYTALAHCLGLIGELRYQHSDAIATSILAFSTEKIRLQKKTFLKIVDKCVKKRCNKISIIRKAKCFGMIKKALIEHGFV